MSLHPKNLFGALSPIAIFAPGLVGASLGLALRRLEQPPGLRVWARRAEAAAAAGKALAAEYAGTDPVETVRGARAVVLCTPVGAMASLAATIAPHLADDAVVTDAGSVKEGVTQRLGDLLGARFCGAHPMAGSERTGLDAARADLFDGACCILTPGSATSTATKDAVGKLWRDAGCRTEEIDAAAHDRILGAVSHLPHLAAACLVASVCERDPAWQKLAGGGYRDTTRIASGAPGMWAEILSENRAAVADSMTHLIRILNETKGLLEANDREALRDFLAGTKQWRDAARADDSKSR